MKWHTFFSKSVTILIQSAGFISELSIIGSYLEINFIVINLRDRVTDGLFIYSMTSTFGMFSDFNSSIRNSLSVRYPGSGCSDPVMFFFIPMVPPV